MTNKIFIVLLVLLVLPFVSAVYYSDTTNLSGSAPVSDAGQYGVNFMVNVVNSTLVSVEKYSNDGSTRALLYNGSVPIENVSFVGNVANFSRPYLFLGTNYTIRTDNNGASRNVVCTSNGASVMPIAGTGLNFTGVYNGCGAAYKAGSIIRINTNNVSGAAPIMSYIYVEKIIVNDNNSTLDIANVTLYINDTIVANGSNTTLTNGTYYISENITNYYQNNYTLTYSGDCDTNGIIVLGYNESKYCILTNNDKNTVLNLIDFNITYISPANFSSFIALTANATSSIPKLNWTWVINGTDYYINDSLINTNANFTTAVFNETILDSGNYSYEVNITNGVEVITRTGVIEIIITSGYDPFYVFDFSTIENVILFFIIILLLLIGMGWSYYHNIYSFYYLCCVMFLMLSFVMFASGVNKLLCLIVALLSILATVVNDD